MALFSTLVDNFDDNSFNTGIWTVYNSGSGTTQETSQHILLTIPGGTTGYQEAGISPLVNYSILNTSVQFEIPQGFTSGGYTYATLYNADIDYEIYTDNGVLNVDYYSNRQSVERTVNYSATDHRWWRFRNSGSTFYFDTSPDSETWTNQLTTTDVGAPTGNCTLIVSGYVTAGTVSTRTMIVDNVNYGSASRTLTGSASGGGSFTSTSETATTTFTGSASGGGRISSTSVYQALPQKDYEYRVFDHANNFIGVWQNIDSDFSYSQQVNQAPSELNVSIARSPDNVVVTLDSLKDEAGSDILDTNGDKIYVNTQTPNAVGAGTDIDNNYNVDVYAYYGGYDPLMDENGDPILDTNGEQILVGFGYPNGIRVYSGYIADYELVYGERTGVNVVVFPHAVEQTNYVYLNGSNTTITLNSTDPAQMARNAMDSYTAQGGIITYSTSSIPLTGQVASYEFNLQTIKEVMDKTVDLLPPGYYHYVDPGSNVQYLLTQGTTADHTFYYEQHITELRLRKTIASLVNDVYFAGGDLGAGVDLFKHYTDATSISNYRRGLDRQTDSRVTLDVSAQVISQAKINDFNVPRYRTTLTISDAVYDIETINLGQMVGFANFGTFVDGLLLQIVGIQRNKHDVVIDLDMSVPNDGKRLEDIKRNILSEAVRSIPTAPV